MKLRTHNLSSTVIYAIALAGLTTVVFFLMNAGIDPRAGHFGDFDPHGAAGVGIGLYGLYHTIAIIFFDDDDSKGAEKSETSSKDTTFTSFIRQPWHKVFSVGPIFALLSALSVFIWHAFAESTGVPGTLWGSYTESPVPATALFFACWAATNLGFTLSALADAFNRDRPVPYIVFSALIFIVGLAVTVFFMFRFHEMPTGTAVGMSAAALLITTATLVPARMFAKARVARIDRENPKMSPRERRRREKFGSPRPRADARPPLDLLQPGENLLVHFTGNEGGESRMLLATSTRLALATVDQNGRTVVLDEARPGQLLGGGSGNPGREAVTGIRLRDRQDLMVRGGDPAASARFAEALDSLARTGRLPH